MNKACLKLDFVLESPVCEKKVERNCVIFAL